MIPLQVLQDRRAPIPDQSLKNVSGVRGNDKLYDGWTDQIHLRGFKTNTTFRDGFRSDDSGGWNGVATLIDVNSAEALKGPAAILYGRVELDGVVNLVYDKPRRFRAASATTRVCS